MRRGILAVSLAFVASFALAACDNPKGGTNVPSPEVPATFDNTTPTTIEIDVDLNPRTVTIPQPMLSATLPKVQPVNGGAFCKRAGEAGLNSSGRVMICATASDGKLRWRLK